MHGENIMQYEDKEHDRCSITYVVCYSYYRKKKMERDRTNAVGSIVEPKKEKSFSSAHTGGRFE